MSDASKTTPLDIVNEQAKDEGLWFRALTAPEGYLQQELRRLHAAVENDNNPERDQLARELAEMIDAQWKLAEKPQDLKLAILDFSMRDKARQLLKLYEEAEP